VKKGTNIKRDWNMKVYEVIKDCTISYREADKIDIHGLTPSNDFVLFKGDFIFIDVAGCPLTENGKFYKPVNRLCKIYYYKMVDTFTGQKEWTWIENLDVIEPKINKRFDPEFASLVTSSPVDNLRLKDVTVIWDRERKLNEIGLC